MPALFFAAYTCKKIRLLEPEQSKYFELPASAFQTETSTSEYIYLVAERRNVIA